MGRQRKFPDLIEGKPRLSAGSGNAYMPRRIEGQIIFTAKETHAWREQRAQLFHPERAGWYDPVAITALLDCLLRLEAETVIVPRDLAEVLNTEYPQFIWTPVIVGRMLGDLAEAMTPLPTGDERLPLERAHTRGGYKYALNPTPANWRWLGDAREAMGRLAEQTIRDERAGRKYLRLVFPYEVLSAVEYHPPQAAAA